MAKAENYVEREYDNFGRILSEKRYDKHGQLIYEEHNKYKEYVGPQIGPPVIDYYYENR